MFVLYNSKSGEPEKMERRFDDAWAYARNTSPQELGLKHNMGPGYLMIALFSTADEAWEKYCDHMRG